MVNVFGCSSGKRGPSGPPGEPGPPGKKGRDGVELFTWFPNSSLKQLQEYEEVSYLFNPSDP